MKRKLLRGSVITLLCIPFLTGSCLEDSDIPNFHEQLAKDFGIIDQYLLDNGITAQTDATSGLRYVIHDYGVGNQPTIDSCVTTNYSGQLLSNGTQFDDGENISFPLNRVILGWAYGMPLLHEGDSATLYVPSGYGYGYYGLPDAGIPKNANLIFNVRLVKVGQVYNGTTGSCN